MYINNYAIKWINKMTKKLIKGDLDKLITILPDSIQKELYKLENTNDLIEVVLDLGRNPEAHFPGKIIKIDTGLVNQSDLDLIIKKLSDFGEDNRAGIEGTLHRISAIKNRKKSIIGLTCRVGKAVFGTASLIKDLVESESSILLMGRPGVGKTTALREIARVIAEELNKRVLIIDTSNEIGGDGDIPHPAIGRARRMQVSSPENQHQVMIEAVENHMPEVIIIDEIGTELEAQAARTIAERGVQLIGTAHGNTIYNLIKNPTLSDLIGGIQTVTLGDEEAKRRRSNKTVLERGSEPTFSIAVEINSRNCWSIHTNVAATVDLILRGQSSKAQKRTLKSNGEIEICEIINNNFSEKRNLPSFIKLKENNNLAKKPSKEIEFKSIDSQLNQSKKINILCWGISHQVVDQIIKYNQWPVMRSKNLEQADVLLSAKKSLSNNQELRCHAKKLNIPIHVIKSSSFHQVERAIKRLIMRDNNLNPSIAASIENISSKSDDEIEALEECRLALEKVVVPLGRPVELLPRNDQIVNMQSDLVKRYGLKSDIFGTAHEKRLRVYPA